MEIKKQNLHTLEASTSRYSDIQVLPVGMSKESDYLIVSLYDKNQAKTSCYCLIDGDFDFYKITFPLTKSATMTNTITKGDDKEREIFEIIENNPSLSAEEISNIVGLSRVGVRYHIKNLKDKGRIIRKGHGKGGSWEIIS